MDNTLSQLDFKKLCYTLMHQAVNISNNSQDFFATYFGLTSEKVYHPHIFLAGLSRLPAQHNSTLQKT